ncbi:ABC transporter substrate-binding protein (plasmid) [Rhizobium sp. CB3090]|uniref:ABC transporter substrate-binding protein n=1 Tax=Rhizobium sp. CB3090 TaxID=3039156 RepID=UPI0024B04F9D|nr:ABC transporter substrate-binding protein [Rhizobium sp. CB3090]WFU12902.1 ABC transporter substrate-binding protein [Rhizobium sp. CB3090]
MPSLKILRRSFIAALAATGSMMAMPSFVLAQEADKDTLRVVMQADLRIIDPIWTTSNVVRDYGYMVYDTLFAMDADGKIQPQMVDSYTVSDDKLTYTFTLRDGLLWHDNQPVTTADIIPSIKRWAARDSFGQTMMTFIASIEAKDDKTFVIKLKEPTGQLIAALGKPSSNVPFMMPKRVAETDPNTQISDTTGSGPYVFMRDQWKPGDRAIFKKFEGYKPRAEAPSGHAGGKVAKIGTVEWRTIADQQQAINALINGEIDIIQQPSTDLLPLLEGDAAVKLVDWVPDGYQYNLRFNSIVKPFDNPKVRQAALYALNQQDFLQAAIGNPAYYRVCKAMFVCGTALETNAGMDDKLESNFVKSKELLAEAGYKGEPVVLLHSTDLPALVNIAPVAKSLLERGGFVVDMQSMDWQTVLSRRVRKDPPAQGGWSAMATFWSTADVLNPVMGAFFNASGDKAAFGWPNDPQLEELRYKFARAATLEEQKAIAQSIQMHEAESPTHVVLGEFKIPSAARSDVSGFIPTSTPVFWNIEKGKVSN